MARLGRAAVFPPRQSKQYVTVNGPAGVTGGLVGWWKADGLSLSNGAAVGSWGDSSGVGSALAQATGANQPTFQTNVINGLPVVRFDGTNDVLNATGSFTPATVFAVAKYAAATFNSYDGLVTGGAASNSEAVLVGSAASANFFNSADLGLSDAVYRLNGTSYALSAMAAPMNAWGVVDITSAMFTALTIQVGQDRNNAGRFWNGDIAEVIVYDTVLSPTDRATVENYLATKYAIALAGGSFTGTASDSFSMSDSAARILSAPRTVGDSFTVTDGVVRTGQHPRAVGDSWTVSDSAARTLSQARSATDSFSVTDSAVGGRGFTRTASDAFTISDSVARTGGHPRSVAESWAVSDSAARLTSSTRAATDSFTISDTAARTGGRPRSVADSWTASDAVTRLAGHPRSVTDTWTISDAATGAGGRTRTASDSFSFTDAVTAMKTASRTVADSWTVTDTVASVVTVASYPGHAATTISLSDQAQSSLTVSRDAATITVTLSDKATSALRRADSALGEVSLADDTMLSVVP